MSHELPLGDTHTLAANTIRGLAMDAVQKANSGHPGMPMGMADAAVVLWTRHLRFTPDGPEWIGRDRFVLSAGHGSMLLYSLLFLAGQGLTLEDLKQFRQWDSKTPGHPEFGHTDHVETTTGPLGQGFANGVGMALGLRMAAARFEHPGLEGRVFGIVSDGDLMEGISAEAASLAGHLGLGNLIYLYDDNEITIDGSTDLAFREDIPGRFRAVGWQVLEVDGHDMAAVDQALTEATAVSDQPVLIRCRTRIAKGAPKMEGTSKSHGAPLGDEEIAATKQALGMPDEAFHVPAAVRDLFSGAAAKGSAARDAWNESHAAWAKAHPAAAEEFARFLSGEPPADLLDQLVTAVGPEPAATRALGSKAIQRAAELMPGLISGSADLNASTKTDIKATDAVRFGSFSGRNLCFGIREHAMAAMMNGLSLCFGAPGGGYKAVGSTFLVFADYMRPSIRLAGLMGLPAIYVFTHDSLLVGEDGPTHQPVEQIAALRLIPNLHVLRPADGVEVAAAWHHALTRTDGPVALCLTRQGISTLERPAGFAPGDILKGAHIVYEPDAAPTGVVLSTGAEVAPTVAAAKRLAQKGHHLRVVSVTCLELLMEQPEAALKELMPQGVPVFAVEMGRPESWHRFAAPDRVIGLSRFGASAPGETLRKEFGFDADGIHDALASRLG